MRILLTNGWSDDNKGDAAIVLGTVNLIHECVSEEVDIRLMATRRFEASDYRFVSAVCRIVPPLVRLDDPKGGRVRRRGIRALWTFRAALVVVLGPLACTWPSSWGRSAPSD